MEKWFIFNFNMTKYNRSEHKKDISLATISSGGIKATGTNSILTKFKMTGYNIVGSYDSH